MQHADEVIDAVHAEQVRATYQQVPIAIVVNVVNAGITATIVAASAPIKLALLWFCAVTLVSIGRWLFGDGTCALLPRLKTSVFGGSWWLSAPCLPVCPGASAEQCCCLRALGLDRLFLSW
jgi:hypothetical protein